MIYFSWSPRGNEETELRMQVSKELLLHSGSASSKFALFESLLFVLMCHICLAVTFFSPVHFLLLVSLLCERLHCVYYTQLGVYQQ